MHRRELLLHHVGGRESHVQCLQIPNCVKHLPGARHIALKFAFSISRDLALQYTQKAPLPLEKEEEDIFSLSQSKTWRLTMGRARTSNSANFDRPRAWITPPRDRPVPLLLFLLLFPDSQLSTQPILKNSFRKMFSKFLERNVICLRDLCVFLFENR